MKRKLYAALQLILGIFILLGILETGNTIVKNYRGTCAAITATAQQAWIDHQQTIKSTLDFASCSFRATLRQIS